MKKIIIWIVVVVVVSVLAWIFRATLKKVWDWAVDKAANFSIFKIETEVKLREN